MSRARSSVLPWSGARGVRESSTDERRLAHRSRVNGPDRLELQAVRSLAEALASRSLTLTVVGPKGRVATMGSVPRSWLQRRLTGSSHIRAGSLAAMLPLVRMPRKANAHVAAVPLSLLPAVTMLPIAPTMRRRSRYPVTTTHDPEGGGRPRLVFAPGLSAQPGGRQRAVDLQPRVTTIGSASDSDLSIGGLAYRHAEIRRDADDEFVFVQLSSTHGSLVNGEPAGENLLRTGTRIELGGATMSFFREELADHGRPYG